MKVHSVVGLIPLFASQVLEPEVLETAAGIFRADGMVSQAPPEAGQSGFQLGRRRRGRPQRLLSLLRGRRMKALLRRMLDETSFLSDYGVRALSKIHEQEPFRFEAGGTHHEVGYWPAESRSGLFGGNSNWRGPIWMPINYLIIEALQRFHYYYGDDFKVECPTGSGKFLTLLRGSRRIGASFVAAFSEGGRWRSGRCSNIIPSSPPIRTSATMFCFMSIFTATPAVALGASHQTGLDRLDCQAAAAPRRAKSAPYVPSRS